MMPVHVYGIGGLDCVGFLGGERISFSDWVC